MSENLKTTKYNDGTDIPLVTDPTKWSNLTTPAYCYYDNNYSNKDIYGALYNGWTILTHKICPVDWHMPTDDDWKILEIYLGMSPSEADRYNGTRGTNEGGILKETGFNHWSDPNVGATNVSGFTALPGGFRNTDGAFRKISSAGNWWTSTEFETQTGLFMRSLSSYNAGIYKNPYYDRFGLSIRCLKD